MYKLLFIYLFSCFFLCSVYGQKTDEMITVTYIVTYKQSNSLQQPNQEYAMLKVLGNKSLFQSYNEMRADSLRAVNPSHDDIVMKFYSNLRFSIASIGDNITYNEVLLKDEFEYEETVNFQWNTNYKDKRVVGGYNVSKATTNYGGQNWTVWYAFKLPINAGPYKFKNLPGLILEARDETGSYVFEFGRIVRKTVPLSTNLKRLYHLHSEANRVKTSRASFNKLNLKIKNFGKQELTDAILTDSNGNSTRTFVRYDVGSSPDENRKLRDKGKLEEANPIELPN